MTTHGDMIMEYGGVPVGAGRLAKIFQAKNIFFVDHDTGQDGASGKKPTEAKKLPSAAVTDAVKEAIIYIRPRTTIANADVYYSDNIVVPLTKPHVQLIGAGAGTVPGYRGAVQIRPLVTTEHTIEVRSSGVVIENLHLNHTGGDGAYSSIYAKRCADYPGAVALQVRGCRLINTLSYSRYSGTVVFGTLALGSCQYCIIEDNHFLGCLNSITMWATHGSPQGYTIRRNKFAGLVSERESDINIGITDINSRGHLIADNWFLDGLPNATGSAGLKRWIWMTDGASAASTGMISGNHFADVAAGTLTYGATGTGVICPVGWKLSGNHDESGLIART